MSAWHEEQPPKKPRRRVPAWLVEKNKTRTDTAKEDRKALADAVREARLKRRGDEV